MPQVDPNLSSGANRGRKQAALAPAFFSSLSSSATPRKLAATVKAPLSCTAPQNEEKDDSYRALGRLVAELGKVRETERQRIAQHLHDRIGQNLILAVMKLSWLETSLSRKKRPMVREVHKLISDTIDETRCLVCDLYPQVLREFGLRMALEWLLERIRANYGLSCVAELVSVPGSVPRKISEIIFQTVRELLVNVAKHARAKRARLLFRGEERQLVIQVIDDGQGFEPGSISLRNPKLGGFGLLSIRERLGRIGGCVHIDSAAGQGTKITITVPTKIEAEG